MKEHKHRWSLYNSLIHWKNPDTGKYEFKDEYLCKECGVKEVREPKNKI